MAEQLRAIQKLYPGAKWHQWDPAGPHSARAGSAQAFGQPINTYYDFTHANVIVSLDCGFPGVRPGQPALCAPVLARAAACASRPTAMNRLYVVEPMPTPTGTKADHRLPLRAGDIEEFAWALAISLGIAERSEERRESRHL